MSERRKRGRTPPDRPLLEGHVRNKKKLIPPMLGFAETSFVSTIDEIFPEIVWIGLVLDSHGLQAGIEVVSSTLQRLWNKHEKVNWYRFSEIAVRGGDLVSALNGQISQITPAFAAMRLTYDWPGLDWAKSDEDAHRAKQRTSAVIRKYVDRFEQPYLTIVATIIYSMAIAGKMKFAKGAVPDIEAIVSDWGSERAEMAACSIRACSMAFFPHDGSDSSEEWCKHFWRKNYQLSSCEWDD